MRRSPLHRKTPLKRGPPLERVGRRRLSTRRLAKIVDGIGDPMAETTRMLEAVRGPKPAPAHVPAKRRTKYARRPRDMDRMTWIRAQSCAVGLVQCAELWSGQIPPGRCSGPVEAHHAGIRGTGRKAPDETCVPLCQYHHRCITDRSGPFAGWPRGAVKAWELAMVEIYQRRYAEHLGGRDAATY